MYKNENFQQIKNGKITNETKDDYIGWPDGLFPRYRFGRDKNFNDIYGVKHDVDKFPVCEIIIENNQKLGTILELSSYYTNHVEIK